MTQDNAASMELMHELLKQMQGSLSRLEEGQRTTNKRLSSIDAHMAAFHSTVAVHSDDMDALKSRIERIERRLDISEAPTEN